MVAVTVRSEPGEPAPGRPAAAADAPETPESAALANSSALSGCTDEVTPEGEDDTGLNLKAITAKVERLRELRFAGEPDIELLPVSELDRRLAKEVAEDYRPADSVDEERALKLVGAIPPGADLYELRTGGLEGQVAGLYLPETKELLVAEGESPGAFERIALAHELEHALTDERLGIPLPDEADPAVTDPLIAGQALVEGSASLLMEFYAVKHIGLGDLLDLGGSADIAQTSQDLARQPYFLQRELLWAYTDGARFACALYRRGGWKAVDRAYADPPAATDQILFPERYGETPEDPPDPGTLPAPWEKLVSSDLGAAELLWLFEAPGGDPERALADPLGSVSAWAGGDAVLWADGPRSALGISLAERTEAPALCAAVAGWYAATRPDDPRRTPEGDERLVVESPKQAAVLRCPPGGVRLGIAPDLELARRLAG
jgi:hypothetical protein